MGENRRRRGLPVGGILLIVVGVVLLLQTLDVLPWGVWWNIWRFWPVLLVMVGVGILLGRRMPLLSSAIAALLVVGAVGGATWITYAQNDGETVAELKEPLGDAKSLDLTLTFGAGTITLGELPAASPNLVEAVFRGAGPSGGATYTLDRSGDRVDLVIENVSQRFWRPSTGNQWEIRIAQGVAVDLIAQTGASDMDLDLEMLDVTNLDLDAGAADIEVLLPGKTEFTFASIDIGAADLRVTVPEGVAARINTDTGLASVNIDSSRFPKTNGHNESPDYDTARYRVDLDIDGGVASIQVR